MRLAILLSAMLFVPGCGTTLNPAPSIVEETRHSALPTPVLPCEVEWKIIEHKERAMVALTWGDSLTLASCNSDVQRYIRQLLNITCEYRKQLEEPVCNNIKEQDDRNQ